MRSSLSASTIYLTYEGMYPHLHDDHCQQSTPAVGSLTCSYITKLSGAQDTGKGTELAQRTETVTSAASCVSPRPVLPRTILPGPLPTFNYVSMHGPSYGTSFPLQALEYGPSVMAQTVKTAAPKPTNLNLIPRTQ